MSNQTWEQAAGPDEISKRELLARRSELGRARGRSLRTGSRHVGRLADGRRGHSRARVERDEKRRVVLRVVASHAMPFSFFFLAKL